MIRTPSHRWERRRLLGGLVALFSFLVPICLSLLAALLVSRVVARPTGPVPLVAWWVLLTSTTMLVLVVAERVTRHLLPLAALLRMSLLFPDRAPSRFRVALRAATVRDLEQQVREARDHDRVDGPARAAETILTLVGALAMHDRLTRGHSERVRAFTDLLAEEMRLSAADRERLRWAALLHDIGKLAVSPTILNKDGKPNAGEWDVIHRHPEEGGKLARPLRPWLGEWADAIDHHHEKWDGTGYPHGLSGEEISLGARIVAVADSFEVMTSLRSYKKPRPAAEARRELAACAGTHFDPAAVRAFLHVSLGRLRLAMGPIAWLAELPVVGGLPRVAARPFAQQAPVTGAAVGVVVAALGAGTAAGPPGVMGTQGVAAAEASGTVLDVHFTRRAVGETPLEHLIITPLPVHTDASPRAGIKGSQRSGSLPKGPPPEPAGEERTRQPGVVASTAADATERGDRQPPVHRDAAAASNPRGAPMPDECRPTPPGKALGHVKARGGGHDKCNFRGGVDR